MLHVVQTAAWDWAPPAHERVPAPARPATAVPAVVRRRPAVAQLSATAAGPRRRMASRRGATRLPCPMVRRRGATPLPCRMARRRGVPRLPCPMARPPAHRASRRSFVRRRCSAHSPMWQRARRCVGGCGTNPIVRPPLRLSMRGLYGAVSHMYVEPGLGCPMFCHLVAPLVFPQDPQETGETRDDPQSIKTEGSGAVGMEVEQVAVLRVLHACFFVASRGWYAPCCAWCAFSAFYMSCLRRASGGQTSRRSRSAEASPRDGRSGGQRRTQGARRRRCRRRCRTHGGLSRGR